jgi:ribosomal protein S27E
MILRQRSITTDIESPLETRFLSVECNRCRGKE